MSVIRSGQKGNKDACEVTSTYVDPNTQALDVVVQNAIQVEIDPGALAKDLTLTDGTQKAGIRASGEDITATVVGAARALDVAIKGAISGPMEVTATEPLPVSVPGVIPVSDNGGSLTVDGTVGISGTVPVSIAAAVPVTDNGGSLTVDGTVGISGSVPVTDGGGSLTVDGTVGISGTVPVSIAATVPVSAVALPLPSGAAQDRTAAGSPHAVRLSDGSAFYVPAKEAQLPSALNGGKLDALAAQGAAAAQSSAWFTRARQLISYSAVYRLTTRPYALSHAFTANTRRQFATIFHGSGSTKTVRLRKVSVILKGSTVAAVLAVDLVRLTAATTPSGGTTITPARHAPGDPDREATCLALPSTAGTEDTGSPLATVEYNLGVTAAASTVNPPPPQTVILWDDSGRDETKPLEMRAGVAEGFAVVIDSSAASTVTAQVRMTFTEE